MKEGKERRRGKDVVSLLLPLIPLFGLMCLCIGLKHRGKFPDFTLLCCTDFVASSWFTPVTTLLSSNLPML